MSHLPQIKESHKRNRCTHPYVFSSPLKCFVNWNSTILISEDLRNVPLYFSGWVIIERFACQIYLAFVLLASHIIWQAPDHISHHLAVWYYTHYHFNGSVLVTSYGFIYVLFFFFTLELPLLNFTSAIQSYYIYHLLPKERLSFRYKLFSRFTF